MRRWAVERTRSTPFLLHVTCACCRNAGAGASGREHGLQHAEDPWLRRSGQCAQSLDEPLVIDGPHLVEHHVPILPRKATCNTKKIRMTAGGERGDDERSEVGIQLVRRHAR